MNRPLLWKLCLIVAIGTVLLFYLVNLLASQTEERLSHLTEAHKQQINAYADRAKQLYLLGDSEGLQHWMEEIQSKENTWAAIVESKVSTVAGGELNEYFYQYYGIGRGLQYMLHPWLVNPLMEVDFPGSNVHFLIRLPDRMRPRIFPYLGFANLTLQIVLPLILLTLISWMLYQHIMSPLRKLEVATRKFSQGQFDIRVRDLMGNRSDELAELTSTFDRMASRISDLIMGQRQLISDLSHELRTPLARLDVALESVKKEQNGTDSIERVEKESLQIRKLVEDTLTLAWLENERPLLTEEDIDLVDLIDVVVEDARFEFPGRHIEAALPDNAPLEKSNHRSLGQALENIIRNAMRFTPSGMFVKVSLTTAPNHYKIDIVDQGPGVPEELLEKIFQPFFRVDSARQDGSRHDSASNFGLGLALAKRQISAIGGKVHALNGGAGGLLMRIVLPR